MTKSTSNLRLAFLRSAFPYRNSLTHGENEIGGGRQLGEVTGSTTGQTTEAKQHSQTASCAGGNQAA